MRLRDKGRAGTGEVGEEDRVREGRLRHGQKLMFLCNFCYFLASVTKGNSYETRGGGERRDGKGTQEGNREGEEKEGKDIGKFLSLIFLHVLLQ